MARHPLAKHSFHDAMAAGQVRVGNAPSYQDPDQRNGGRGRPGAKAVGIMIVNLDNGTGETYYSNVDRAIRAARKQGILVIGYTYTGYSARDPKTVRRKINAGYRNYLVDGMFFDAHRLQRQQSIPSDSVFILRVANQLRAREGKERGSLYSIREPIVRAVLDGNHQHPDELGRSGTCEL